jgi:hypothetical protein
LKLTGVDVRDDFIEVARRARHAEQQRRQQ